MQGNRKREITAYMPDTLTSWTITGFALSPSTGLSIIKQPLVAKVSHDFFIVANLPYSIKRDEVVVIQATVFNNLGTGLSVDVKLYSKSDEIKFYNDTLTSCKFSLLLDKFILQTFLLFQHILKRKLFSSRTTVASLYHSLSRQTNLEKF